MNLDTIVQAANGVSLPLRGHAAKEALQRYLLVALQQKSLLVNVAFIGGTALRLLHNLPRYSEDLDFIWTNRNSEEALGKWKGTLMKSLTKIGASGSVHAKRHANDGPVTKRFYTIYLSATSPAFASFARHGIQISFEIDLTPPEHTGWEAKTLLIAGNQVTVPTLTLPSLMAGKLHILLTRKDREKGRDWFDYLWYRQQGVTPNIAQLDSAIKQTGAGPEARYWTSYLRSRIQTVTWLNVRADVKPFLENQVAADQLHEVAITHLTPYPDFKAITAELHELKNQHPLLLKDNPVIGDISKAAAEGEEDAIYARFALDELAPSSAQNIPHKPEPKR